MPFLSKDKFQDWADDGTSNVWRRVNAEGAFRGLCYAAWDFIRNMRPVRLASSMKYRIITDAGDPHIEVAQAETEEEFMDLLRRLNSLTAKDVMLAASSDRKEMLQRLIERAKRLDVPVVSEHQEFLSMEVLDKISRLERTEASLQRELEQAKKALRKKETEQQELQDEFCGIMAQQALEDVSINTKNQDQETSKATASTECIPNSSTQSRASASSGVLDAPPPEERQELNIAVAEVSGALPIREASSLFFPENSGPGRLDMGDDNANRETQLDTLAPAGSMSFVERVLHGHFQSSLAKAFWQLAMAPYRSSSCNQVELEGKLWEVIAQNSATETLAVGRKVEETGILELGFRGTVMEDAYGQRSAANWSSSLDAEAVSLQGPNGASVDLLVHKGFQDAYLTVNSAVVQWLEKMATSKDSRPFRLQIAGHSLGGALATLAAVDLMQRGWQVAAVVTFGSPRIGQSQFRELYEQLQLSQCTARFVNQADPVPWVPPARWDFEHVVEEYVLALGWLSPSSHSMEGSAMSYLHTLQDAVEGRQSHAQHSRAARAVTRLMASGQNLSGVTKQMKEELKVDIALVRQDIGELVEGMVAAVQALRDSTRQIQQWEWLLDMETLIEIVADYKSDLQSWREGVPQWFLQYKIQLKKVLEATKMELDDHNSKLAPQCLLLYLRAASFLLAAMNASSAPRTKVEEESKKIVEAMQELFAMSWHLEVPVQGEVLKMLPRAHRTRLVDPMHSAHFRIEGEMLEVNGKSDLKHAFRLFKLCKWTEEANLAQLTVQLDNDKDLQIDDLLQQLGSNIPNNLTSLRLHFGGCVEIKDASLQRLASHMPPNLISLTLAFRGCEEVTLQQLARHMPQNLTSLSLKFEGRNEIKDASLQQLASHIPHNLNSLRLNIDWCHQVTVTNASLQQLASHVPQNLTSLSLKFRQCKEITDASLQQLASHMPQNLTSLSLDFWQCHKIADASLQQLASHMPQNLTSLSLNFRQCKEITDASLQQLASHMPQNLTSLSLDSGDCGQITDASLQQLASHMPQCLTSLSLCFFHCEKITDASLHLQLASHMPQNLTSLSLDFACCEKITDASFQQLASHMPQNLTSLGLYFAYCGQITDASFQQLASHMPQNLASRSLDFWQCHKIADASLQPFQNEIEGKPLGYG